MDNSNLSALERELMQSVNALANGSQEAMAKLQAGLKRLLTEHHQRITVLESQNQALAVQLDGLTTQVETLNGHLRSILTR